jgi:hypothetical protein
LKNIKLVVEISNRNIEKIYICNILLTSIELFLFAKFLILNLNIITLQDLANINLTNLLDTNFFFIIVIFLNITFFANLTFVDIDLSFIIIFRQLFMQFLATNNIESITNNK